MTAEIVNLNKFRKARDKAEAEQRAAQNRVRYGRSKTEKERLASEERGNDRVLDGAKLEGSRSSLHATDDDDGTADPGATS